MEVTPAYDVECDRASGKIGGAVVYIKVYWKVWSPVANKAGKHLTGRYKTKREAEMAAIRINQKLRITP